MKVLLHELKDQDLEFSFDEGTPWVMELVGSLDERADRIQRPVGWKPKTRETRLEIQLRRVDDLIHVSGKIKTQLYLLCSLCADAFAHPIQTQFHALLTQSEDYTDTPRESTSRKSSFSEDQNDALDDFDHEDDSDALGPPLNLNSSDFEITVLKDSVIDLKEVIHEQLVLQIPIQPKPPKNEKDECLKCGKIQAAYLPETAEPLKENPFTVLKNFKTKKDPS